MNDKTQFPFWDTDWLKNQKQYMDAWSSFQQFMPDTSSEINPMYSAMSSWWSNAAPHLSEQDHGFYQKMMQQGKSFYFMGEQFSKLLEGMSKTQEQSEDWQALLNEQFESMKAVLSTASVNMNDVFSQTSSVTDILTGGLNDKFLEAMGMTSFLDKILSMPGFGPDREKQAQIKEGIKLFNEYQQLINEFNVEMGQVGVAALELMRIRITGMAEKGEEISSLRQIYDLWVDCNEVKYGEYASTEEYSKRYGRLTNAMLAVKQHNGKVMDEILAKLNIPTRQGMNTVLKRVQEMKRSQARSAVKIAGLEGEVQALRALVEGKRKTSLPAKSKTTGVKKKASKKTTNKKTSKKVSKKTAAAKPAVKSNKKTTKKVTKKTTKKSSTKKSIIIDI